MTRKITIISITGLILFLFIYGYFKAIPGVDSETDQSAKIEVTPQTFDFGDVTYKDLAEHTFKITNTGQQNLEINKVTTSCACTSAKVTKDILAPGEQTDLFVTYDTGLMTGAHAKGNQDRTIFIRSNDPINPQIEVMIYANVR